MIISINRWSFDFKLILLSSSKVLRLNFIINTGEKMGKISLPDKVKLFIGIIGINKDIILKAKDRLVKIWGEIDSESDLFEFNLTSY